MTRLPGWLALVAVVALACAMLLTALTVRADAPSLAGRIAGVVPMLASKKDAPVDALEFGAAVSLASRDNPTLAALMIAMAAHESALSDRIRRGECREHECDAYKDRSGIVQHKAWGTWQQHRNLFNDSDWGSDDLAIQARSAARVLRGAIGQCKKSGQPFPVSVFRAARGYGCAFPLKGEDERARTYQRVIARLQ